MSIHVGIKWAPNGLDDLILTPNEIRSFDLKYIKAST